MAKTKRKTDSDEPRQESRSQGSENRHTCECICLQNIPGYPYRLGYAKMYVDAKNMTRCVYCCCLTPDPRELPVAQVETLSAKIELPQKAIPKTLPKLVGGLTRESTNKM